MYVHIINFNMNVVNVCLLTSASPLRDPLLGFLEEPMEVGEEVPAAYRPRSSKLIGGAILPELDVYLHLLVLLRQLDSSKLDKVRWEEHIHTCTCITL